MFSRFTVPVFLVTILLKHMGESVTAFSCIPGVDRFEAFPSICKEAVVSHTGKLDALIQYWDRAGNSFLLSLSLVTVLPSLTVIFH